MARTLKVYGSSPACRPYVPESLSPHRQTRHIVAATSKTAACRLLGTGRDYTGETSNAAEIRVAMSAPGTVFWQTHRREQAFAPVPVKGGR